MPKSFLKLSPHTAVFIALGWVAVGLAVTPAPGAIPDTIGVTLLRAATTNLNGAGVRVAQPEGNAGSTNPPPTFEVNPGNGLVNQPTNLFTYISSSGTATTFTNLVGLESGHANGVGANCYGTVIGVATNVAHVDNYDADYFINSIIVPSQSIPAPVVNQSFVASINDQAVLDTLYDNFAAQYGNLFVSGVGNGGPVSPPATCYNGIGVGASDTPASSVGPTLDNGRAKPDISAPGGATSFSTPFVTGAAAVLLQAGLRGDGGSDTNAAADSRTLKALLLNGALKPTNWTHTSTYPLDTRYGAGVLNVFNSYMQFAGGKHGAVELTSVNLGNPHPPGGNAGNISVRSGWDFATMTNSITKDRVNHYYFQLTNSVSNATFTVTTTLVWNRQQSQTAINDLDLFLYNAATSNLVAESISGVDNVEHLHVAGLPTGRYDLQVLKHTSLSSETYALAFEFFTMPLSIALADTNAVLTWPVYPTGFALESATDLAPVANWSTVNTTPLVTNGWNRVEQQVGGTNRYFRLRRPNL